MRQPPAAQDEASRIRAYLDQPHPGWGRWPRAREFAVHERRSLLLRASALTRLPAERLSVCDVGCGAGSDLAFWRESGVEVRNLAGTELAPSRAASARMNVPGAHIVDVAGPDLPFPDARFVLTTSSLVLSLQRDVDQRAALFSEMRRITQPGGVVAVYDFRVKRPANDQVVALTKNRVLRFGGAPDAVWPATPLLPFLELVLHLPAALRPLAAVLPRTHAMWVWLIPT